MITRVRHWGWIVFVLAVSLRAGWVLYQWSAGGAELTYDDERLHWQLATNLVRDGSLVSDDGRYAARMPLYPLLLAVFVGLGPYGMLAARLAQAVIGAVTAVVAHRWAGAAFGPRAGVLGGLLVAVDPFAVFAANLLLTEVVFTAVLVSLVAATWWVVRSTLASIWALAALSALGAAAILTRPSSAALVPALWLVVAVAGRTSPRRCLRLLLCPAVVALMLLPWGLRNRGVVGAWAWLSTNGGVTLYDAQGPQADGSSNQVFLTELPELSGLDEVARDRQLQLLALEQMRRDPGRVLRLAAVKFCRTWSPVPNVADHRRGVTAAVAAGYTIVLLAGAVVALVVEVLRGWRDRAGVPPAGLRRWAMWLTWLAVGYFTVVHSVYIGSVRYRVPLMPLLAVAAASVAVRPITERPGLARAE